MKSNGIEYPFLIFNAIAFFVTIYGKASASSLRSALMEAFDCSSYSDVNLRQYTFFIMDFKSDLPVHVYVEMEVGHFYLFEHIRQLYVLIPFDFLAVYHKANWNRVPQFRCDFSCFHCVFHLSFFVLGSCLVSDSLHTTGGKARLYFGLL